MSVTAAPKVVIGLPDGLCLSPAHYVAAVRKAKANPAAGFKQSFCDPTGWMGPHTGASIVREYLEVVHKKWAQQWAAVRVWGEGSKAKSRAHRLEVAARQCAWCGSKNPKLRSGSNWYCEMSCLNSYRT